MCHCSPAPPDCAPDVIYNAVCMDAVLQTLGIALLVTGIVMAVGMALSQRGENE